MRTTSLAALLLLAPSVLLAQSPFDGTWVQNQQESNMAGQTMKIEDAGNGAIKFADPNFPVTVKTDGTKAQTAGGGTMAMEKKSNDSYHETDWLKGNETSQSDWNISNDGKTLTIHDYGTNPNGEAFSNTTTYTRVSGATGLAGEWKTTSVKSAKPATFTMKLVGNVMTWDIPAIKGQLKAPLNGTAAHPNGPTVPESLTLAVTKKGPRTLGVIEKLEGKTVFTGTYTVAADGKRMTVEGRNARGEMTKAVWEKQG
jgi:hypothetical protein